MNAATNKKMDTQTFQTSLYSSSAAPYCVVTGLGPVGKGIIITIDVISVICVIITNVTINVIIVISFIILIINN